MLNWYLLSKCVLLNLVVKIYKYDGTPSIVSGKVLVLLPRRVDFSNFVFTIGVPHRCGGASRALELAAASLACFFFFSQV